MKNETELMKHIQLSLTKAGCTVFRNETAGAWVGKLSHRERGMVVLDYPQRLQAGLCVGSSDLIGWTDDGRFLAVEVKFGRGRPTDQQSKFVEAVNRAGGVAGVVWSVDEALALLD